MLYYQTAQKSVALQYDESDLSVWKMKMFDNHFGKKLKTT